MLMLKQNIRGRELDSCGLGVRGIGEPERGLYFFFVQKTQIGTLFMCVMAFLLTSYGGNSTRAFNVKSPKKTSLLFWLMLVFTMFILKLLNKNVYVIIKDPPALASSRKDFQLKCKNDSLATWRWQVNLPTHS